MKPAALILLAVLPAFAPIAPANPCSERVWNVSRAIKMMENTRAELNNPGGLSRNGKLLRFPSYGRGEAAQLRLIYKHRRLTIRRLLERWAPDGLPTYAPFVAKQAGMAVDGPVCGEGAHDIR